MVWAGCPAPLIMGSDRNIVVHTRVLERGSRPPQRDFRNLGTENGMESLPRARGVFSSGQQAFPAMQAQWYRILAYKEFTFRAEINCKINSEEMESGM